MLKRVRGTPLPTSAYLAGIGATRSRTPRSRSASSRRRQVVFGLEWPQDWVALVVFVVLGVVCFARSASRSRTPSRTSTPRRLRERGIPPVIFISGVFYDTDDAPAFLRGIAEALPLKHLIDGLSGAMVTGEGLGDNLAALGVLALWTAVGLVLAVRGFSWDARRA